MPTSPKKKLSPLETLLDQEKTAAFAEYLSSRIDSVARQMQAEFIPKREQYAAQMIDDFSWRSGKGDRHSRFSDAELSELVNSIFDLQNDSLNIVGGFAAFMTARSTDDLFGTDPFYSINPEGMEDDELAEGMQKHSEWKLRRSPFKSSSLDAIDLAFGLGEGVLKVAWETDIDVYETDQEVLVDGAGDPITTVDGDYVGHDDVSLGIDPSRIDPATGQAMPAIVVPKDPSIVLDPAGPVWQLRSIEKTNVAYSGVKVNITHFKDILCPLTEESIENSPFVGHRFQMRLSEARNRFQLDDKLVDIFSSESTEDKANKDKPNDLLGESAENFAFTAVPDPIIEFVECWVKYDPVGDGRLRRIRAILAVKEKRIIEMDYSANKTPAGELPFFCVRGTRVKNRWYGRGMYEQYEKAQEFIDRNLCRIEYRNRFHANPVIFFDPTQLITEDDQADFEMRPGASYRTKPGIKPEEVFHALEMPDLDERTWKLMQFMIQVIQVRSGVTSAAQGEVSSLPSTATATGIESIMASASTLARLPINSIKETIEKALLYAVKLIYRNMDRDEIYTYFEGDQQKAAVLSAEQVKDIDMNVRLLMTRFKQRESLESAGKAIDIMSKYVLLPEPEKGAQRPLFIQAIKGLGFEQADSIVRQPLQMGIDPTTGQQVPIQPPQSPNAPLALPAGQPPSPQLPPPAQ